MSRVVRKLAFCICENKYADQLQLRGHHEADQRICFRYIDSILSLLSKYKFQASSHLLWLKSLFCVCVVGGGGGGGVLTTRLKLSVFLR